VSRVERQALVEAAFGPAEYVEQESFLRASEIRSLAEHAGVGPGVSVLDLCCGIAGPGRFLARELGCEYLGVDASETAVAIARERARGLPCRFEVAEIPPLPGGEFDVVLLLETMLAFRDKETLLEQISGALPVGGRFAFTLEEGRPLSESERAEMPDADTVWLTPLDELHPLLARAGLTIRWQEDWSEPHRATAEALADAYAAEGLDELVASHRLWAEWLATGRVRKFAVVAERQP
jgi:SAM-dependent methyltransferase